MLRQKRQDILLHTKKWEQLLQINLEPKEWQNIHLICFKTIQDNHIIWLQYRIIHRILGTKVLLHKMKKSENNHCRLCNRMPETLIHIFTECPYSTEIWVLVRNWIQKEAGSILKIASEMPVPHSLGKYFQHHEIQKYCISTNFRILSEHCQLYKGPNNV